MVSARFHSGERFANFAECKSQRYAILRDRREGCSFCLVVSLAWERLA